MGEATGRGWYKSEKEDKVLILRSQRNQMLRES